MFDFISDVDDGTKALIVAKDVDKIMQMMETMGSILLPENLFDRAILSDRFLRWVKAPASDPRPFLCNKNLFILNCILSCLFQSNEIAAEFQIVSLFGLMIVDA